MTTEEIKRAAAEVRDERNESANTATRVGKVLVDLCEAIDAASSEAAATNGATNQLMKKYSEYLEVLKPWLVGKLREADFKDFAAFNSYMDSLRPDGPLKSGRYRAVVSGVPLFVTYVVLSVANQIAVVWVEGFFAVTNNALSINHEKGFTIASRYFGENSVWHRWKSIRGDWEDALNDLKGQLPTAQSSAYGSNKNYIYSNCNDAMHLALSGHIWIYHHKTDGNLFLRFKNWGANKDEKEESYSQVMLPNVSSSQRGLMDKDVFRRINNQTFSEVNSTTDAVNINYTNFGADGNKTLTISKATSAKAGVMTAADRTYLDVLKKWNIGLLGEFKDDAAFNDHLDNNIGSHSLDSGRYVATVGGVPLFVTFVLNHSKTKRAALWVEGSFWLTDGKISINSDMGVTIAYRICNNDVWGSWKTIRGESNGGTVADVPTVQTSASGNNKNYIYSNSSDAMHLALCGKIWIYRHGTDGNMFLRFKNWGANNDEREEAYSQVMLPNVSNSQRGLMDNDVFRRINNHTLSEVNSTTNAVNINYTNLGADGNKQLTISKATSAKAGVMTADQYNNLNQAVKDIASLRARIEALEAK
jgi:hypothetical protein